MPDFDRLIRLKRGLDALPAALLMSVVATFDSNMADVVRAMLRLRSETFQTGGKTVPLNEILQAKSIEAIKAKILDDEIYQFSRGSHEEQVQYIERNFHISISKHWKRWPDFIEVFERRNLIAHGEKKFTERYVSICKKHNHRGSEKVLGTPVRLTSSYLSQANGILLEFATLLIFSLWRKHFPNEEQRAFDRLNQTSFDLIKDKEYVVPVRILEYAINLNNASVSDKTKRMMVVNLASAHAHMGENARCEEVLGSMDWSATSENFRICVAALQNNVDEVCKLMPVVSTADTVRKKDIREWPVFDFIRNESEVLRKFEEVYGEPMNIKQAEKLVESPEDRKTEIHSAADTLH